MKLLFDFLPIILFFATFKYADAQWATAFASQHFSWLVSGGVVGPEEGPVLLATLVVIAATLLQVVVMRLMRQKINMLVWVSLALILVLGGATIWFHSTTFIKWKPTLLYWFIGLTLSFSAFVLKKNLIQRLLGEQLQLPDPAWHKLNLAWIAFSVFMGALNLYVALSFPFGSWVSFKAFGITGLTIAFAVLQGVYLSRHLAPEGEPLKDGSGKATPVPPRP